MAKKEPEAMVLMGFGKKDLKDLLELIGTPQENLLAEAPVRAPARWRRQEICSDEEVADFRRYVNWVQGMLVHEQKKGNI
jgi:hypothetical protein